MRKTHDLFRLRATPARLGSPARTGKSKNNERDLSNRMLDTVALYSAKPSCMSILSAISPASLTAQASEVVKFFWPGSKIHLVSYHIKLRDKFLKSESRLREHFRTAKLMESRQVVFQVVLTQY